MIASRVADDWRALTLGDIEQVVAIERLAYSFPWSAGNFADSIAAGYPGYTAWQAERLLGYCLAMRLPYEWHILNLCVHPRWQGQGVGRGLLAWVETSARTEGAESVLLEVRASNLRARQMYERAGYFRIGLRRHYYPSHAGREDAIVMRMHLPRE